MQVVIKLLIASGTFQMHISSLNVRCKKGSLFESMPYGCRDWHLVYIIDILNHLQKIDRVAKVLLDQKMSDAMHLTKTSKEELLTELCIQGPEESPENFGAFPGVFLKYMFPIHLNLFGPTSMF